MRKHENVCWCTQRPTSKEAEQTIVKAMERTIVEATEGGDCEGDRADDCGDNSNKTIEMNLNL